MPPDPLDWHASHASVLHILRYPSLYINTVLPRKPWSPTPLPTNCVISMSGHFIQWSDMLSGHLRLVIFVTVIQGIYGLFYLPLTG